MFIGLLLRFIVIGGLVPLLVSACRPENEAYERKFLIRSIASSEDAYIDKGVLTFDYNGDQQLINATVSFKSTQSTIAQSFSYSPGHITMTVVPAPTESGVLSATYSLNSAGYITKITSTERVDGSTSPQLVTQSFSYTKDGFLSGQEYADGTSKSFTYLDHNFFVERHYHDGIQAAAYNYYYSPNTPSTITPLGGISTFAPFYRQGLFGLQVANAVRETSNIRGTTTYSYTYDDRGNATSVSQTYQAGNRPPQTTTLTYTYTCP